MTRDHLSDLVDLIEVRGVISGGFSVTGRWRTEFHPPGVMKLIAITTGQAMVHAEGADSVLMNAGDVVVLNDRSTVVLEDVLTSDDPQERFLGPADNSFAVINTGKPAPVSIIGGHIDAGQGRQTLLTSVLPPLLHVSSETDRAVELRHALTQLADEMATRSAGSAAASRLYAQLLALEVLRVASRDPKLLGSSWLRGFSDARLQPVIELMHDNPRHSWQLDELARAVAMSRTAFTQRFTHMMGTTPRAYLTSHRMLLARRELANPETSVAQLSHALGYGSESAFSTAFKREVGMAPRHYRETLHAHS